jgi:hypothetical protein
MAKKIELSKEKFEEIRKFYLFEKMTTKQISKKLKISETVICKNLKKNGLYINTNDIDKTGFKKGDLQKEIDRIKNLLTQKDFTFIDEIENNEKKFIAVCKITGKEFNDYKNSSGVLTNHFNEIFPDFVHPTNFKKREYKIKHKKYWHEQYFDIIEIEDENIKKFECVYCNWKTIDLENKSGSYTKHLKDIHKLDVGSYLKQNKEHEYLFKTFLDKKEKKDNILSSEKKSVECIICKEKFAKITGQHVKSKHGISLLEYRTKFSNKTMSENYRDKMVKSYNENLKNFAHTFTSKAQKEIKDFLLENNINVELNNRKVLNGVEIDILCENKKIGIEYNGNMFHSEVFGKKDSKYHLNKTILMGSKNYSLIHIFEDEWENKKNIVKSKLRQIFNLNKDLPKIYARKCDIRKISYYEKNNFLEKNHIQGKDNGNIYYGAFFKDKLVSVMTFISKRNMFVKNEENSYELSRFATDINYRVVGMAGKLISYFIKEYKPDNIVSFADRRWTLDKDNNLYTKIGFNLTNILHPDYSYYNSKIDKFKRFHKFNYGKKSIKIKYPSIYDDKKTEWEMMQELGFDRIWDCGKFCYELNFKK